MKVRALRCLSFFSRDEGFECAWMDGSSSFALVRESSHQELFEGVLVDSAGERGEAVVAYAALSVVRGRSATKGLVELEVFDDLAHDRERGYAILESKAAAIEWERRLAAVAALRVRKLAQEKGPDLLRLTGGARAAARRYLDCLPPGESLEALTKRLREMSEPSDTDEARRLSEWPGVVRFERGAYLYEAASLAMSIFGGAVDQSRFRGANPLEDPELMWRIQILVDLLDRRCASHGPGQEARLATR